MGSVRATWPAPAHEVVDLSSDDEGAAPDPAAVREAEPRIAPDEPNDNALDDMLPRAERVEDLLDDLIQFPYDDGFAPLVPAEDNGGHNNHQDVDAGQYMYFGNDMIFVPVEEQAPVHAPAQTQQALQTTTSYPSAQPEAPVTADACLTRVLEIFPDISHEYVYGLYNDFDKETEFQVLDGKGRLHNIIEQLINATSYPKQERGKKSKKRKHQESAEPGEHNIARRWDPETRAPLSVNMYRIMQNILKADFPEIVQTFIAATLRDNRYLFQSYVALGKAQDDTADGQHLYGKGRPSHLGLNADLLARSSGFPGLEDELRDARAHVSSIRNARREERENLEKAKEQGTLAECTACFDELPMNRQIYCSNVPAHFTCFDCAVIYLKTKVGESQCNLSCPSGCGEDFPARQLNLLPEKKLLEKLAQLQQAKDIRDAQLENLEECPSCDFKAIAPPIEEDFEFRCHNPECEVVSCRRCRRASHIPKTCEQYAKENKLDSRHKVEEAMTAALVRSCNKCKNNFIKEYGCNKMTCPSCGNRQCYVCSETITDYHHFDHSDGPGHLDGGQSAGRKAKCPLHDDVNARHEREVRQAQKEARDRLVEENPDLEDKDLDIPNLESTTKKNNHRRGPNAYFPGALNQFPQMLDGAADMQGAVNRLLFEGRNMQPGAYHGVAPRVQHPHAQQVMQDRRVRGGHDHFPVARVHGFVPMYENAAHHFPPPLPPLPIRQANGQQYGAMDFNFLDAPVVRPPAPVPEALRAPQGLPWEFELDLMNGPFDLQQPEQAGLALPLAQARPLLHEARHGRQIDMAVAATNNQARNILRANVLPATVPHASGSGTQRQGNVALEQDPRPAEAPLDPLAPALQRRRTITVQDLRNGMEEIRDGMRQLQALRNRRDQYGQAIDHLLDRLQQQQARIRETTDMIRAHGQHLNVRMQRQRALTRNDHQAYIRSLHQFEADLIRNRQHARQLAQISQVQQRNIAVLQTAKRQFNAQIAAGHGDPLNGVANVDDAYRARTATGLVDAT